MVQELEGPDGAYLVKQTPANNTMTGVYYLWHTVAAIQGGLNFLYATIAPVPSIWMAFILVLEN
jgi:hypothetical protein